MLTLNWTNHPDTLDAIGRFRFQHLVLECGLPATPTAVAERCLLDPADRDSMHLVVRVSDTLVGALRLDVNRLPPWLRSSLPLPVRTILDRESVGYVSRCVVSPRERGRSVFPVMLAEAYRVGRQLGLTAGLCHARPELQPLYLRLGWLPCTPVFDHPVTGPQIIFFRHLPGQPMSEPAAPVAYAS